jgi:hypothetical protein
MFALRQAVALCSIALVLGCGSATTPPPRQVEDPSPTPTTTPSPSPTPLPTAVRAARASWGASAQASDIVTHLRAAGLTVDPRSPPPQSTPFTLFGAESREEWNVENERLSLYSFATAGQAEDIFLLVSQRRETVTWEATPYFVKIGQNLAVLTTMNEAAARRVVDALVR